MDHEYQAIACMDCGMQTVLDMDEESEPPEGWWANLTVFGNNEMEHVFSCVFCNRCGPKALERKIKEKNYDSYWTANEKDQETLEFDPGGTSRFDGPEDPTDLCN